MRESNDMTDVRSARPQTNDGRRMSGIGRVLVAVYAVLALAAIAPGDRLVAIVERRGTQLKVVTGFPPEESDA